MDFFQTETGLKILGTLISILSLSVLQFMMQRLVQREVDELRRRYVWRQTVNYVVFVLGGLLLVRVWFEWVQSILTLLSLVAAALIVVSKELLLNLITNGVIIWRGLFSVGDRIQVGAITGDVVELGPVYFGVAEVGNALQGDEPTGRMIKIPNSIVLTTPVANYSRSFSLVWHEISLEMPLSSNWHKARKIIQDVLNTHSHQFSEDELKIIRAGSKEIVFTQTTPSVYLRLHGEKYQFIARYVCKFYQRRATEYKIWEALLTRFQAETDIKLEAGPAHHFIMPSPPSPAKIVASNNSGK